VYHNVYEIERMARETPKARQAEAEQARIVRMARAVANAEASRTQNSGESNTLEAGSLPRRLIGMLRG
jgi:hypothetical protein